MYNRMMSHFQSHTEKCDNSGPHYQKQVFAFIKIFLEKDDNIVKSNLCKIDGNNLKYNSNPKLLGITLDEELNFQQHVNRTEKKASRALQIIREVKGISQISTKKLIELYVILVRSIMEYGCSVWQTVTRPDLKKLENIQKKALALCLDLPVTASREAMVVFPPAPKKGMLKFPGKGHFKRATLG